MPDLSFTINDLPLFANVQLSARRGTSRPSSVSCARVSTDRSCANCCKPAAGSEADAPDEAATPTRSGAADAPAPVSTLLRQPTVAARSPIQAAAKHV